MAYNKIGQDVIDRNSYGGGNYTDIDPTNSAPIRGILKQASVYAYQGSAGWKIKVFRDDGTNFIFIGESAAFTANSGAITNVNCWIPVEKGDLIGVYMGSGYIEITYPGSYVYREHAGDVTTTTLKSTWNTTAAYNESLGGLIFTRVAPF